MDAALRFEEDRYGKRSQTTQKCQVITNPTRVSFGKKSDYESLGNFKDTMMPRFGCRTQVRLELGGHGSAAMAPRMSSTERGPTYIFKDDDSTTQLI